MFHPFFFHNSFHSCHCHNTLADAMALAAAFKVEEDLQQAWREDAEKRVRSNRPDDKDDPCNVKPEVYHR